MLWFILAFLAAIFYAIHFVLLKKFLKNINQFVFAFVYCFLTSVILLIISFSKGLPDIGGKFYLAVFSTVFINIFINIFTYRAVQISDLSLTVPMMSFTPVFLIFTSFLLLGELPSWLGILGIILIFFGSYLLDLAGITKNLLFPFLNLLKNKGQLLMLTVAFLASISVNFDKMAVLNSDWVFSSAVVYFLLALSFLIISLFRKYEIKKTAIEKFWKFFLVSLCSVSMAVLINLAYTMQIASYVISIKRLGVLFSVIFGALFFKEKNLLRRLLAVLIMLLGVVVIVCF